MSKLVLKCEKMLFFKQNFTAKLYIAFKWPNLAVLPKGEI